MKPKALPDRLALISDIHSNIEALEAVLNHIRERDISEIWCIGDIVGYGPDPVDCIQAVRENCSVCVLGNHDHAALSGAVDFNPIAEAAVTVNARTLETHDALSDRPKCMDYLRNLPCSHRHGDTLLVHASPRDPVGVGEYLYVAGGRGAITRFKAAFDFIDRLCFCGHTHFPGMVRMTGVDDLRFARAIRDGVKARIPINGKAVINTGSVGQPRDGDPRASYVELAEGTVIFHRVEYPSMVTAGKIFAISELHDDSGLRLLTGE